VHPQPASKRRNTTAPGAARPTSDRSRASDRVDTEAGSGATGPCAVLMGFEPGLETEGLVSALCQFDRTLEVQVHRDPSTLGMDDAGRRELEWILFDADALGIAVAAGIAVLRARLPKAHLIVFGRSEAAQMIGQLLQHGADAYVPRRFTHEAILAVFALVRAGERFRPTPTGVMEEGVTEPTIDAGTVRTLREFGLTKAEQEVLVLVAQGKTNLQIALELDKGEGTVRVQMSSILRKLKVSNRAAAILVAMRDPIMIRAQFARVQEKPLDLDWLHPHMEYRRCRAGEVLFQKGDLGREMFVVQRGCVSLPQLGLEMRENDIFGEIAIFAPNHRRTSTAVCATDTDLFVLGEDQVRQMHFVNPAFALTVLQLITNRLLADRQRGG
jgi:two-component system, NarL family, nitrate/nitrite response regulator NarL